MDDCAICMVEINLKDSNTTLAMNDQEYMECWHVFHMTCMLEWLQTCHDNGNSKSCPVCRTHCGELCILVYELLIQIVHILVSELLVT